MHVFQHLNKASPDFCVQVGIWTPEKNENSKFTLEVCSKLRSLWSIFKKKPEKKSSKYSLWVLLTCVSSYLIWCKRLEINPITLGWENSKKLPENCKIRIWPIFASFWTFSLSGMIRLISSLLHLFRILEAQV